MSIRRQAARTATRVTAYRIARRSGIGALVVLLGALWASMRPAPKPERLGHREEYMTGTVLRGTHTVKDLAEYVYRNPTDTIATVDLAQAVLEFIAREEEEA